MKMENLWNPLTWMQLALEAAWGVLKGIWDALMSVFGMNPKAPRGQHDDITPEDVTDAAKYEASKQELVDMLNHDRTPAQIVHSYAAAGVMDRPTVDLSALTPEQQDWLVGLSNGDYILLAASGVPACDRSLSARMVIPSLTKLRAEKAAEEAPHPVMRKTREEMIRDIYRSGIGRTQDLPYTL